MFGLGGLELLVIMLLGTILPITMIIKAAKKKKAEAEKNKLDKRLVKFVFWMKLKSGLSYYVSIVSALIGLNSFSARGLLMYEVFIFLPIFLAVPVISYLYGKHYNAATIAVLKIKKKAKKEDQLEQTIKALEQAGTVTKKEIIIKLIVSILISVFMIITLIAISRAFLQ